MIPLTSDDARKARAIDELGFPLIEGEKIVRHIKTRDPLSHFPHYEREPFTLLTLSSDKIFIIFKRKNKGFISKGYQSSVMHAYDYNEGSRKVYYRTRITSKTHQINDENEMKVRQVIKGMEGVSHFDGVHYYTKKNCSKRGAIADYYPEGDLLNFLQKQECSKEQKKRMMSVLLKTLKQLHALRVIHRDIKLENIYLRNGLPLIGDFGFAILEDKNVGVIMGMGSLSYMAPEILPSQITGLTYTVGKFNDIWALGCVFFSIINRLMILGIKDKSEILSVYENTIKRIEQDHKLQFPKNEIVRKMLIFDYRLRPKAEDLIDSV